MLHPSHPSYSTSWLSSAMTETATRATAEIAIARLDIGILADLAIVTAIAVDLTTAATQVTTVTMRLLSSRPMAAVLTQS